MKISTTVLSMIVVLNSCAMAGQQQKNKSSANRVIVTTSPAATHPTVELVEKLKLRVVSYNIEKGVQSEKVLENLSRTNADLILLQEEDKFLDTFIQVVLPYLEPR